MATLQNQLKRARKLNPETLEKDLFKFVRSIEKVFLDLEKERISVRSEDIFGKAIGFYSKSTERITKGRKEAGKPFTGIESGDWFKGFYMKEEQGNLRFGSTDPKTNDILTSDAWLSDDLFGLSDDDLKKVISERVLPFFIKHSKTILGL